MLKKINPKELNANPFTLLDNDWALLMAGDKDSFNSMTVSWGGVGVLWRKMLLLYMLDRVDTLKNLWIIAIIIHLLS